MHRIKVGVIRGGPSDEYEVSLNTGATVLESLSKDKYNPIDIFIDKNGVWHIDGRPIEIFDALSRVDIVFNALHGYFGEDGKIQHLLESCNIRFTGSSSFASALGMNKSLSKEVYRKSKLKTPLSKEIKKDNNIDDFIKMIFKSFSLPIVVKPVSSGSSVGVSIVKDFSLIKQALEKAFEYDDFVLIEEYISGKEASCGVIDDFRNQSFYALPPIEIRPHESDFFDYNAKYLGKSDEIVPGNFTNEEKREIERLAIEAHKILGLRHYSRTDFIVNPKRGVFILESNTLPGLTEESLLPKALHSVGSSISHFLDHIIGLAMSKK